MTRSRELAELASAYDSGSSMGFRRRTHNGDMRIDQRNAGASVTPSGLTPLFPVDRFFVVSSQATSRFTAQQNAGSVVPPTGFRNYLGCTVTSVATLASADEFMVAQRVEGFNIADFGWGTSSAQPVTLSFWVRSSLTGNFGVSVRNADGTRSYPALYSISSANTWEYKTVSIPGETTGTWGATNGSGLSVSWGLGIGASASGPSGAWASTNYPGATGATSVVGTNGATFYITGVQLEAGTVATPFERRPYGMELALCQRYYCNNFSTGNAPANGVYSDNRCAIGTVYSATEIQSSEIAFPVAMRSGPSIAFFSPSFVATAGNWAVFPMSWGGPGYVPAAIHVNQHRLVVGGTVSGGSNYATYIMSGYFTATAEL